MSVKLILTFVDDDDHFNRERWALLGIESPNVWWVSCSSDEEAKRKSENLLGLPGVESVEVVYEQ